MPDDASPGIELPFELGTQPVRPAQIQWVANGSSIINGVSYSTGDFSGLVVWNRTNQWLAVNGDGNITFALVPAYYVCGLVLGPNKRGRIQSFNPNNILPPGNGSFTDVSLTGNDGIWVQHIDLTMPFCQTLVPAFDITVVDIKDSFNNNIAVGFSMGYYGALSQSLLTAPFASLRDSAGTNPAAIAASSWGNVLSFTTSTTTELTYLEKAGASLDITLIAQAGAWRITVGGVEQRKYLVPAGQTIQQNVAMSISSGSTVNLDFYNTSTTTAIPIGAVLGWWRM